MIFINLYMSIDPRNIMSYKYDKFDSLILNFINFYNFTEFTLKTPTIPVLRESNCLVWYLLVEWYTTDLLDIIDDGYTARNSIVIPEECQYEDDIIIINKLIRLMNKGILI